MANPFWYEYGAAGYKLFFTNQNEAKGTVTVEIIYPDRYPSYKAAGGFTFYDTETVIWFKAYDGDAWRLAAPGKNFYKWTATRTKRDSSVDTMIFQGAEEYDYSQS